MNAVLVEFDATAIHDWPSFHDVSAATFGFPNVYGRNMDAWIDCMTYRDDDDGMAAVNVKAGEAITIQVNGYQGLKSRCPEVADAINECVAFVNWRRIDCGDAPILFLSYHE